MLIKQKRGWDGGGGGAAAAERCFKPASLVLTSVLSALMCFSHNRQLRVKLFFMDHMNHCLLSRIFPPNYFNELLQDNQRTNKRSWKQVKSVKVRREVPNLYYNFKL